MVINRLYYLHGKTEKKELKNAAVVQLVERNPSKVNVTSSRLVSRSKWFVSSVGRAFPLQGRGHRFESYTNHQIFKCGYSLFGKMRPCQGLETSSKLVTRSKMSESPLGNGMNQ